MNESVASLWEVYLKLGLVLLLIYGGLYAYRHGMEAVSRRRVGVGAVGAEAGAAGAGARAGARVVAALSFLQHAERQITILETRRLAPRQALHLVKVGSQTFLIGATDQNLTTLAQVVTEAGTGSAGAALETTAMTVTNKEERG